MHKPFVTGLVLTLALLPAAAGFSRSYQTAFRLTEEVISEGGTWVNGGSDGLDWTDVATLPGLAYGLESGSGGYDDATALLGGAWGPSQSVTATVHSISQTGGEVYEEVEIRLRSTISAHWNEGYEVNFRCLQGKGSYVQIVRWNGPLGNFTYLADVEGMGVVDGDVVRAAVSGDTITVWINGVKAAQATDGTFRGGSPGMGFFLQGASGINRDYGFSRFAATDQTGG